MIAMDRSLVEVWEGFLSTLEGVGLAASFPTAPESASGWDVVGLIEGVGVAVIVKSVPSTADISALVRRPVLGSYVVLVARRLSATMRADLAQHGIGFFDARGYLRLWRRPLLVDITMSPLESSDVGGSALLRLDTPSLLDVALGVLDGTIAAGGVRAAAAVLGRSPGTVSKLLAALRSGHLANADSEPTVPDLFDSVADVWHPIRVPLADLPRAGGGATNNRLQLGFDDLGGPGWVLADAFAAAAWGAPVVLSGDAPPDFYVPDPRTLRLARTLLGDAQFGRHACTVAVAPAPFVCRHRYDRTHVFNNPFMAPSPVVAALDLAVDPGRGRETLERWSVDLPQEVRRVW